MIEKETDPFSKFLKAQILLNEKKPLEAFEALISTFTEAQIANSGYMNLILRTATSLEADPQLLQSIVKAISKNIDKV